MFGFVVGGVWLKIAKELGATLPVAANTRKPNVRFFRVLLGREKWQQDVLRHTAASYWLAQTQDAGKVARWLGNSAGILLRFYTELVEKEPAEQFWKLIPTQKQITRWNALCPKINGRWEYKRANR